MTHGAIPHSRPSVGEAEAEAAARVLRSGLLAQGREVAAFEAECAAAVGRRHAVAVNSGTAALHLALIALGIGPGRRVAVPAYACAALVHPVHWQNAETELCDIGEGFAVPPEAFPRPCDAAVAVHLFGRTAPLPGGLRVIEDIAQSLGGRTGRAAPIAVASFYATKMITTGEGGILLTDDAAVAELARDRRDYDNRERFAVRYAYKMTDFQAAMGRVQLRRLPEFVERRQAIARAYLEGLSGLPLSLPDPVDHVFFRFVVMTPGRDALQAHLAQDGIDAKRPVHRPAHHYLGGEYPNAERAHHGALSLPIYPELSGGETRRVIDSVRRFFD